MGLTIPPLIFKTNWILFRVIKTIKNKNRTIVKVSEFRNLLVGFSVITEIKLSRATFTKIGIEEMVRKM